MQNSLIALGGNVTSTAGRPDETLCAAVSRLAQGVGQVMAVSPFYSTPCFPAGAGPDYVNAALVLRTDIEARDLLDALHRIEADFGRERVQRWGQRTLDLDLLAVGDHVRPDAAQFDHWRNLPLQDQTKHAPAELILPHPRLQDRAFVLVPLADVAPDWRHPVLGQTTVQLRDALPAADLAQVVPLAA